MSQNSENGMPPKYKIGMSQIEILKAGGEAWLIKELKEINQRILETKLGEDYRND